MINHLSSIKKSLFGDKQIPGVLGVVKANPFDILNVIKAGVALSVIRHLQELTALPEVKIAKTISVSSRTLVRRKKEGRLTPIESERLMRIMRLFEQAVELHEGNTEEAVTWLTTPKTHLRGQTPFDFASTEIGAREVERFIIALEHGVFL